jgi:hypothetical protein
VWEGGGGNQGTRESGNQGTRESGNQGTRNPKREPGNLGLIPNIKGEPGNLGLIPIPTIGGTRESYRGSHECLFVIIVVQQGGARGAHCRRGAVGGVEGVVGVLAAGGVVWAERCPNKIKHKRKTHY